MSCPGGECLFSCGPNKENREADVTDYLKAEWEGISMLEFSTVVRSSIVMRTRLSDIALH